MTPERKTQLRACAWLTTAERDEVLDALDDAMQRIACLEVERDVCRDNREGEARSFARKHGELTASRGEMLARAVAAEAALEIAREALEFYAETPWGPDGPEVKEKTAFGGVTTRSVQGDVAEAALAKLPTPPVPLTGPELAAKHGFKPHGRRSP